MFIMTRKNPVFGLMCKRFKDTNAEDIIIRAVAESQCKNLTDFIRSAGSPCNVGLRYMLFYLINEIKLTRAMIDREVEHILNK